jgi:hypothetical protein
MPARWLELRSSPPTSTETSDCGVPVDVHVDDTAAVARLAQDPHYVEPEKRCGAVCHRGPGEGETLAHMDSIPQAGWENKQVSHAIE